MDTRGPIALFGPNLRQPEVFCAEATAVILAAMADLGIRRLVCQTGAMIGNGAGCRSRAMDWFSRRYAASHPALAQDRVEQERLVMASDADWLIVKPPRLTSRRAAQPLQAGAAVRVGMLSSVGREDLATLLLSELTGPSRHTGRIFVKA